MQLPHSPLDLLLFLSFLSTGPFLPVFECLTSSFELPWSRTSRPAYLVMIAAMDPPSICHLVANRQTMRLILQRIDPAAASDNSVLLVGETGSGQIVIPLFHHCRAWPGVLLSPHQMLVFSCALLSLMSMLSWKIATCHVGNPGLSVAGTRLSRRARGLHPCRS